MQGPTQCAKCGGSLSTGFIVDEGYGSHEVTRWQDGDPKPAWYGGIKSRKKDQIQVSTYRCDRCGYLESYALSTNLQA